MGFKVRGTVPTEELIIGDTVILKGQPWGVVDLSSGRVTVERDGRRYSTDKVTEWTVLRDVRSLKDVAESALQEIGAEPVVAESEGRPDLITVQEYLRAVGMPDEDLERSARTFGTVLLRLYRERHGKDARPARKLEYVPYLDVNGMEAQRSNADAPRHLRVKPNGWYESNAFEESDLDLLEAVHAKRHPSLPTLSEAVSAAVAAIVSEFPDAALGVQGMESAPTRMDIVWLAERQIAQCLASGVVCGHEACARRRAKTSRRISVRDEDMDWS